VPVTFSSRWPFVMADPNRYFGLLQHPRVDESLKPDKLYVLRQS
jgi:hypothetical protein